jgi:hypothetical protein
VTAATGQPAPSWPTRIGRILLIALVFVALGPPVGALVLFSGLAIINVGVTDPQGTLSIILFGMIFGGFFSYFIGGVPAALVGLAIGAWQVLVGRVTWYVALTVGLGAGLVVLLFFGRQLAESYDAAGDAFPQQFSAITMLVCALPTLLCWAMVRNWYWPAPAPTVVAAAPPVTEAQP